MVAPRPVRVCERCGRTFAWRRKWARSWNEVRLCSERCRRRRADAPDDALLERTILRLLAARAVDASICPSEVARALAPDDWRPLMQPTREAARRLAARGDLVFMQRGQVVDPSSARGPVRLRRRRAR